MQLVNVCLERPVRLAVKVRTAERTLEDHPIIVVAVQKVTPDITLVVDGLFAAVHHAHETPGSPVHFGLNQVLELFLVGGNEDLTCKEKQPQP